jgi:hypothetical protein
VLPQGLQRASFSLSTYTAEPHETVAQLVADLRCLALCPVPCQVLHLHLFLKQCMPLSVEDQVAAAVAELAATLTHLSLSLYLEGGPNPALALCQALPKLRSLKLYETQLSSMAPQLLRNPSLTQLLLRGTADAAWVEHLPLACKAATATPRPQGTLTVQLPTGQKDEAVLAAARQQWYELSAHVVTPASSVVVTDAEGRDLLAAL